jgi:hypothetical protein
MSGLKASPRQRHLAERAAGDRRPKAASPAAPKTTLGAGLAVKDTSGLIPPADPVRSPAVTRKTARLLSAAMAMGDDGEFKKQLREDYLSGKICLVCLGSTDSFFLLAGSQGFHRNQLAIMGVPPMEAALIADNEKRTELKRTPVCPSCAQAAYLPRPTSETTMRLMGEGERESPVPVQIIAETPELFTAMMEKIQKRAAVRMAKARKQEEYEMRLKGAQKDVADFVEGLEANGYLADQSSGHIKIYHDGRFITTISQTPKNAYRTVLNAKGHIARWERENLKTEPEPQEAAAENDDDMPRQYIQRTLAEKAAIVARYDYADEVKQRELLEKHHIRHRDIARFREQLTEGGYHLAPAPILLADEPDRTQMCETCGTDKALTAANFAQEKAAGKYRWSRKCHICGEEVATQVADETRTGSSGDPGTIAVLEPDEISTTPLDEDVPLDVSEATRMITLMGRKRDISARLAVIDAEKAAKVKDLEEQMARLTAELDEEKKSLTAERGEVETELLELVSG